MSGDVVVENPFGDVAVNVVEPERVRLLQADLLGPLAVLEVPGVLVELLRVVAEEVGRRRAAAGGPLPLGLGGQR